MSKKKEKLKPSIFAHFNVGETSWFEWRTELLLLAELAQREDGVDVALAFAKSVFRHTGLRFDGTMSSWREIFDAARSKLAPVREENPAFFFGLSNALLGLFDLNVPVGGASVNVPTEAETLRIPLLLARAEYGRTRLATRMKAHHRVLDEMAHSHATSAQDVEAAARAVFADARSPGNGLVREAGSSCLSLNDREQEPRVYRRAL